MHEVAVFVLATGRARRFTPTAVVALAALVGLGYVMITWRRRRAGGGQVPSEQRHPGSFELTARRRPAPAPPHPPPTPAAPPTRANGSRPPSPADGSTTEGAGGPPPATAPGRPTTEGAGGPGGALPG
ncbi:MAG: hypothetical protein ACYCU7_11355 [Acidimicrobiales bacterium]